MSNIYTSEMNVPRTFRNKRRVQGDTFISSVTTGGNQVQPYTPPPVVIIPFTSSATPTITNYDTTYAEVYGQFPRIELYINSGTLTRYKSQLQPQFTLLSGTGGLDNMIDTVFFDIGEALSGWIIISI